MDTFIIIFGIILFIGIFLIIKFRKKKFSISQAKMKFFKTQLNKIMSSPSYKEQIVDIDKLYHKILIEAGYNGTFGEILKSKPSEIGDINKIWELHKLRNKLVHDFNESSDSALKNNAQIYKSKTQSLLKHFG